jgi:HSP20 family molecular chaperone IbpA
MSFFTTLIPNRVRAVRNGSAEGAAAPTVKPYYEVQETDDAYSVTVYLPGVTKENLEITVEADEFRVSGRRAWKQPEGWAPLHRESADEAFELVLSHDNAVNAEKVTAELRDGVLRVALPKHEAVKPRKIAVG